MVGVNRYIVKLNRLSTYKNRNSLNFIGVVVEFSVPRRTCGTDYCTTLKIIDQSQQSPEFGVNIFMRDIDDLPHIRAHKDIILLCDFKIDPYNGTDYAVYDHRKSSFALFDGEITNEFTPYQASPTYHPARSDNEDVRRLRNWSRINTFNAGLSEYDTKLKDIGRHDFIDLECKVLHICEISNDKWMLFVWDGTRTPALELCARLGADELNPVPLQVEPTSLPTGVLSDFPSVGTVLRVTIDETYEKFGCRFKFVKEWVKLRNLHVRTVSGLWKGVWTMTTKIRPLPKSENCIRDYNARVLNMLSPPTTSNMLTDVQERQESGFRTLMELITTGLMYGKFKCLVRFLMVYPSQSKDFVSPNGEYMISVILEDPTARIRASLSSNDAVVFFGGHPDENALTTMMNKLLGISESSSNLPRNPPNTACCIGFTSSDENDMLGSRQYHICDTRLVW